MLRQRLVAVAIVVAVLVAFFFALSAQAGAPPSLGNATSTTHGHESSTSDDHAVTTDSDHATTTDDRDHATTTDDKDHPSTTDDHDRTTTTDDHDKTTTTEREHPPTTECPEPPKDDKDHPPATDDHGSAENAHPPSSHEPPATHDDGDHPTTDDRDHHPSTTDDKDHRPPDTDDCAPPTTHKPPPPPPTSGPPITTVVTFPPNDEAFAFGAASTICRAEVPTIVIDFRSPGIPALAGRTGILTFTSVADPTVTKSTTVMYEPGGHVEFLYPGTAVNPDGSIADVPGWILQPNGLWVIDPSDAFLREGIHLSFTVNPTAEATITYPPESAACANPENPAAPPGNGIPPAL